MVSESVKTLGVLEEHSRDTFVGLSVRHLTIVIARRVLEPGYHPIRLPVW